MGYPASNSLCHPFSDFAAELCVSTVQGEVVRTIAELGVLRP